jgi:hypothetical protein
LSETDRAAWSATWAQADPACAAGVKKSITALDRRIGTSSLSAF